MEIILMNNKTLSVVALGACVAACTATMVLPAIFGLSALGAGGLIAWLSGTTVEIILISFVGVGLGLIVFGQRLKTQTTAQTCASDGSCGCKTIEPDPIEGK
jgi:membrane protein implicated in regulation of membrane protease activity